MVKTEGFGPGLLRVTGLTLLTQTVLVFVILTVAGDAGLAGFFAIGVRGVARAALRSAVLVVQHIFRVLIVSEGRRFPGLGTVTTFALFAIYAFVPLLLVIFLVTGKTFFRRVLIDVVSVALGTLDVGVLAG